jgi:uncharacterized protein (TIGR00255 family)
MTRSMTGFGKATRDHRDETLTIEVSAVNHRYLDCSVRMPNIWTSLEPVIKQTVKKAVARGKVNVVLSRKRTNSSAQSVSFDEKLAEQYVEASRELAQLLGTYETLSVDALAQMEGVFYQEEPVEDLDELKAVVDAALSEALEQLNSMRVTEGGALGDDLRARVGSLRDRLAVVETRLPELNERHSQRLRARIEELKVDIDMAEERIALEVAILADKGDVTEEVVRLKTHLDHMLELLESKDPSGRRLDFLAQELQREFNTLGVKTRDVDVAKDVLEMKAELEKIREQVQNIE